jgi:hypothetical protein
MGSRTVEVIWGSFGELNGTRGIHIDRDGTRELKCGLGSGGGGRFFGAERIGDVYFVIRQSSTKRGWIFSKWLPHAVVTLSKWRCRRAGSEAALVRP